MKVNYLQMGGEMAPASAEQAPQGENPEEQLAAMAQQVIERLGPDASLMLAQMIMEMLQDVAAPQEAPVYARKGGRLVMKGRR